MCYTVCSATLILACGYTTEARCQSLAPGGRREGWEGLDMGRTEEQRANTLTLWRTGAFSGFNVPAHPSATTAPPPERGG